MKMMSDYSCGLPLWDADEASLTFPGGVSPALIKKLKVRRLPHRPTGPGLPEVN